MSSGVWLTSKVLEQRFRSACSLVVETVLQEGGDDLDRARADGPEPALRERLGQFETLKREQTELARLALQYAKEQQALKDTEHALGTLIGHVGMHEPRRNMSDCLSLAADLLKKNSKQREEIIRASDAFSKAVSSFLSTAVADMETSKAKYDMARRQVQAAQDTLSRSRSALVDPARRALLQVEVDESRKLFDGLSVQLSSKVRLGQHHRNRQLCESASHLCDVAKAFSASCSTSWGAWQQFVPDEQDALDVIERCYHENMQHNAAAAAATAAPPPAPESRVSVAAAAVGLRDNGNNPSFQGILLHSTTSRAARAPAVPVGALAPDSRAPLENGHFEEVDLQGNDDRDSRIADFASYLDEEPDSLYATQKGVRLAVHAPDMEDRGGRATQGDTLPCASLPLTITSAQSMYQSIAPPDSLHRSSSRPTASLDGGSFQPRPALSNQRAVSGRRKKLCVDNGNDSNDGSAAFDPAAEQAAEVYLPSRPSLSEGNRLRGQGMVTEEVVKDEKGERQEQGSAMAESLTDEELAQPIYRQEQEEQGRRRGRGRDGKKAEGHSHLRAVAGADGRRERRVSDAEESEGEVFQGDSAAHHGRVLLDLPATNGVYSDGNASPGGRGVEGGMGEGDAECRGSWRQPLTPRLPAQGSEVAMQIEEHRGRRPVTVRGRNGWPHSPGREQGSSREEGECSGNETEDEVVKRLERKSANAASS